MKKVFGIILIIVGLICLPKVFTPSVPETIGGLTGISLVSFLPAYFLLREKKGKTQSVRNQQPSSTATSEINHALGISTLENKPLESSQRHETNSIEEDYDNLFEELKAKCHPKQFMEPYDHEKVKVANELYARILNAEDDTKKLEGLRAEAMKRLGIKFSSKSLYDKLMRITNPANFMDPYDAEKVAIANDYYQKVQQNAGNIIELEALLKEINNNSGFSSNCTIVPSIIRDIDKDLFDGTELGLIILLVYVAIGVMLVAVIAICQ